MATADPLHHGVGYDTPSAECRPQGEASTAAWARASVQEGFDRLAARDAAGFLCHAAGARSDFRDPGPVLAHLLGGTASRLRATMHDVRLVDYAAVLGAPAPTWVAGALATFDAPAEFADRAI